MNRIVYLIFIIQTYLLNAQLQIVEHPRMYSEAPICIDQNTQIRYSDLITIKFTSQIINIKHGESEAKLEDINDDIIKDSFMGIMNNYSDFKIIKLIPSAVWGDTLVKNRRSGETNSIPDWSQVFQLKFYERVPIDLIIEELNQLTGIEYAEAPIQIFSMIEPNDPNYKKGNNWAFDVINARGAWEITRGNSSITIGIVDDFGDSLETGLHEDLVGKVDRHFGQFGNHGRCVAGVAGAMTDNAIGIASLGWNLRLGYYDWTTPVVGILNAINDKVDIINFSWVVRINCLFIRDAVKTALANGIVCVGAAGNSEWAIPDTLYPAAYNFGDLGQVIAVTSTKMIENEERFFEGYNYSPGNDPIMDPTGSFVDVAAPGSEIELLDEKNCAGYTIGCGTSLSAAFVSSLAGLILSINRTLTPTNVYNIITGTADKIAGSYYDGWNRCLGYGRINTYEALLAAKRITNVSAIVKNEVPNNNILNQNYPNPFNPNTIIKYTIQEKCNVTLKVIDVLGSEVITLVNKEQPQGNYEIEFDGKDLTSGIYFYRFQVYTRERAGEFVETKKMILLK